ncbi:NAD-dependent epimerase/dehydratase family protein [Micromonospora craniellae]|uniref:NAD-dependent epimerase/dehydratase family protein n=1 Tax=Micromonospora craniellae TaxID=2294034 RepID=UPI001313FF5D|nr:NAD-dependent epimerase/dehydratase family protein [Micromonospora craniellae]QOC93915.1 NAD-dependent epimerase/dehydratase family protein [Micromonospora craniellae]
MITGASGFLGGRLAIKLRRHNWQVVGIDSEALPGVLTADIRNIHTLRHTMVPHFDIVIHLASLLSARCESDPTSAFDVNVGGTATLLNAVADKAPPALLMASSIAVFDQEHATDDTPVRPQSVYGTSKAMSELLIADATRRGSVRGHIARLPTVAVRPGPPSGAASAFASTMVKNALDGVDIVVPVPPGRRIVLTSVETAVENLRLLADAIVKEEQAVPKVINMPGVGVDVDAMAEECLAAAPVPIKVRREVAGDVDAIVGSWPSRWESPAAIRLGLQQDPSFASIVAGYKSCDLP